MQGRLRDLEREKKEAVTEERKKLADGLEDRKVFL